MKTLSMILGVNKILNLRESPHLLTRQQNLKVELWLNIALLKIV